MSQLVVMEPLEERQLLASIPIPTNINLSKMRGSQSEGAVTVDPTNANRIFVVSNIDRGDGLFTSRSSDGGAHWSGQFYVNDNTNFGNPMSTPRLVVSQGTVPDALSGEPRVPGGPC